MESNMQAVAGEKLQWDVKRQPAGKILSLDRQEAKKVLEIYVSRSLSCRENALTAKKELQEGSRRRGEKADELQRSNSDFCQYQPSAKLSPEEDRQERPKAPDVGKALEDESKTPKEVPKEKLEAKKKSTKSSSQGKGQRSLFKTFISFLFKKSPEEQKENAGQKAKEKDAKAPHSSKAEGAKRPGVDSSTSPPLGRAPKRRPSLKKVFSFKKHAEEERGEAAAGARAKRPSCLPLRHIQTPATPDVEPPDGYYARVSEEIELLVQGRESQGSRADPHRAPPQPASTDNIDEAIKRIVTPAPECRR
ncbi:uncharacterized protein [Melanerpes formicivorus]|uniref:uncharacterized protein isoform X1 n=1 Tax=Melanerpes formicivorus TaxID=211600 RepID=UPI00358EAB94